MQFQFKRRDFLKSLAIAPVLSGCANFNSLKGHSKIPFEMPNITLKDFSNSPKFNIIDFGAEISDIDKTSIAIENAISKANEINGGVVVIPSGIWPTKKIHFKSNVNLHLDKDAVLLFSEKPEDYLPPVKSSWEGLECMNYSPLIYAYDCENIAITGEGKIKAKLDIWKIWYARPKAHLDASVALYYMAVNNVPIEQRDMTQNNANMRPQFIQFNRCKNILLQDYSMENSPFWCTHLLLCKDIIMRRVKIRAHGHNNDGVDPEMTQNMIIEDCIFNQGDDAISVKSGREFDAWRLNTPSKNIIMRNCIVKNGHQLMAIGSELAGGVENVFVDNCKIENDPNDLKSLTFNILFIKTNERRGGFVKNIFLSNVTADKVSEAVLGIDTDVLYQWRNLTPTVKKALTPIEDVYVTNVTVNQAKNICVIKGNKELPIKNIGLKNVKVLKVLDEKLITTNVVGFVNK